MKRRLKEACLGGIEYAEMKFVALLRQFGYSTDYDRRFRPSAREGSR